MKWLYVNNCLWDDNTFDEAIKYGNLDNIKWLYINSCPWGYLDTITIHYLKTDIKYEHILYWLRTINDFPWKLIIL